MRAAFPILALAIALAGTLCNTPGAQELAGRCSGADFSLQTSPGRQDSTACLSCHDGVIAADVTPGNSAFDKADSLHNHPVRVSYQQVYSRDPSGYVPPSMLDARVKLVGGEVHCVSCHAVSTPGRWTTVKSNSRSALCLSCHRK